MFRKNLIEFSIRFELYKCLFVYVPDSHNHKTFTKNYTVLPKGSYTIYILSLLYSWIFPIKLTNVWDKVFFFGIIS